MCLCVSVRMCVLYVCMCVGKTGVTADRDKIEFRLFNSSSIFNITLREELFSLPKKKPNMLPCPGFMGQSPESSSLERS